MKNLKQSLKLPLEDQRHGTIGDKSLRGKEGPAGRIPLNRWYNREVYRALFEGSHSHKPFAYPYARLRCKFCVETAPSSKAETMIIWIGEQDGRCVHLKLCYHLVYHNPKRRLEIVARANGEVDRPQAGEPA